MCFGGCRDGATRRAEGLQPCYNFTAPPVARNFLGNVNAFIASITFRSILVAKPMQGRGSIVDRAHASRAEGLQFEFNSMP